MYVHFTADPLLFGPLLPLVAEPPARIRRSDLIPTGVQYGSKKLAFLCVTLLELYVGAEVCNPCMLYQVCGAFQSGDFIQPFKYLRHSYVKLQAVCIALVLVSRQLCRLMKRCYAGMDWASSLGSSSRSKI